eukprot:scaffold4273_cov106-Isochrysis_galbana.AAC.7
MHKHRATSSEHRCNLKSAATQPPRHAPARTTHDTVTTPHAAAHVVGRVKDGWQIGPHAQAMSHEMWCVCVSCGVWFNSI